MTFRVCVRPHIYRISRCHLRLQRTPTCHRIFWTSLPTICVNSTVQNLRASGSCYDIKSEILLFDILSLVIWLSADSYTKPLSAVMPSFTAFVHALLDVAWVAINQQLPYGTVHTGASPGGDGGARPPHLVSVSPHFRFGPPVAAYHQ